MLQRQNDLISELLAHEIKLHPHLFLVLFLSLSLLVLSFGISLNRETNVVFNEAHETSMVEISTQSNTTNQTLSEGLTIELPPTGKLNKKYITDEGETMYVTAARTIDLPNLQISFENLPPGITNTGCSNTTSAIQCAMSGTPTIPGTYYVTAFVKIVPETNIPEETSIIFPFTIEL